MQRNETPEGDGLDYRRLNQRALAIADEYEGHGEVARAWALRGLVDGWIGGGPMHFPPPACAQYYRRGRELGLAADWHGFCPPARSRLRIAYCAIDPCTCSQPSGAHAPGCPADDIDLPQSGGAPCGR